MIPFLHFFNGFNQTVDRLIIDRLFAFHRTPDYSAKVKKHREDAAVRDEFNDRIAMTT